MFRVRGIILVTMTLLVTINQVPAADPAAECPSSPNVATTALRKKIFCNYDFSEAPLNGTTAMVDVAHYLFPEFFVFDEYINNLEIHGDTNMEWKDPRLRWDKSDYNGLDRLVVQTNEIWVPDLELSTPASMHSTSPYQSKTHCQLSSNGAIRCLIPLVFEAHCNPDVRRWPFDTHTCSMNVSTRTSQIHLIKDELTVSMMDHQTDNYWRLIGADCLSAFTGIYDSKWPTLVYVYTFERHTGFIIATFFVPSIVMLVATLCVFCLDPAGVARMFLIGTNIICHCLFLMYLAWYLPANGDKTPVILTFFRDSLILVGVSLVVTVCATTMAAASRAPPAWLAAIADLVQDSPARCLLFNHLYVQSDALDEPDNVEAVMASSASNKWRIIATLLDRVTQLVFAVILAVLAFAFLP